MDFACGLQRMARLLLRHVALGQFMQLLVDARHQLVERAPVPWPPTAEQRRHVITRRGHLSVASISPAYEADSPRGVNGDTTNKFPSVTDFERRLRVEKVTGKRAKPIFKMEP
jgi:hypothetical protein